MGLTRRGSRCVCGSRRARSTGGEVGHMRRFSFSPCCARGSRARAARDRTPARQLHRQPPRRVEASAGDLYVRSCSISRRSPLSSSVTASAQEIRRDPARGLELRVDGEVSLWCCSSTRRQRRGAPAGSDAPFRGRLRGGTRGKQVDFATEPSGPDRLARAHSSSARDGARCRSTVPAVSESDLLRAYPADLLRSPLDVRPRRRLSSRGRARARHRARSRPGAGHRGGGFEALIERGELTLG